MTYALEGLKILDFGIFFAGTVREQAPRRSWG